MRKAIEPCFFAVCLIACGGTAYAQEVRASLGGRVTDSQGALVPHAAVSVISGETSVAQRTLTNSQGNWLVQFLIPGRYRFTVTAAGFKTIDRGGIVLQTADNKTVDVQLEVGAASQSVEVTGETPLIDTTSATSGTVITTAELNEIPSASRIATLLATLSPGVIAQDQNNNVAHMWSYNAASQVTVDGGRNNIYSNNFQLDGMPNTKSGGNIGYIPSMDSVSEFRIITNAYDASIGRQAGGTISISTKSGAKDYHGNFFEFNQNNFLNANLFQTNLVGGQKPPVHFNEYGGTFGGPVWIPKIYDGRQRTFFFVSFDGTRNQDPRFGLRSVPTALERQGDFRQSFTTQMQNGQLIRFPIQIYDPLSVDTKGFRTQFPNNTIPVSRLNPIAQNILKYVPLPNTPGEPTSNATNNYVPNSTRQNKMAGISIRADQQWSNNQRSFATIRWSHEDEFTGDDFHSRATGNLDTRIPKGVGVDHVWTLSANKLLDLRFNVSRYEEPTYDNGSGFNPVDLGFPASFVSQLRRPSFPRITGFGGALTDNPQSFGTNNAGSNTFTTYYTWTAGLTHIKGNHTMHYGAEYWILQQSNSATGNQGQFDFSNSNWTRQQATVGGGTGNGSNFAAFLLGLPNGGNVANNADAFYSQHYTAFYFQDDWRITKKLTFNAGLRWDYERPVTERYDRLTSNFDPNAINPINARTQANYAAIAAANANNANIQALLAQVPVGSLMARGAQLFAGVGGQSNQVTNSDHHEFQPRAGFAWQLGRHTVIRGGFGRFVQASWENATQNGFSISTPFVATRDNYFTPFDTLSNPFHSGVLQPTGSTIGALTNLGQGVKWVNQNANRPYSWEYSLHLQQQIRDWLLEIGYSHNKTYGIWPDRNRNYPSLSQWQNLRAPRFDAAGRPLDKLLWDELVPNPFQGIPQIVGGIGSSGMVGISQLIRPIAYLGDQNINDNPLGTNQYDALLAKAERRFSKGFSVIASFTWSKLFEDTSFLGNQVLNNVEHKLGGEDRPFHLALAPIVEIPVGRGRKFLGSMPKLADVFADGWEVTAQYNVQSGVPVVFGTDAFFDGKDIALPKGKQSLNEWFDTTHFIRFPNQNTDISNYPAWTGIQNLPGYNYKPAPGDTIKNGVYQDFGNYVRNYPTRWGDVRASRVNELNAGLYKNFRPTERMTIQYRFEAFNALNHPRFAAPNTDPTSSSFGRVSPTQENSARVIQMALKLYF